MNPALMLVILLSTLGYFAWTAARRTLVLFKAQPDPRFDADGLALGPRVMNTLVYAFGQKKMPYYRGAGLAHIPIFFGFVVLLLRVLMLWGRGFDRDFDMFGVLALTNPVGVTYNLLKEAFGVLVLLGCSVFFYYRLVAKPKRMTLSGEGLVILGLISVMMLGDMLYDAASLLLEAREHAAAVAFSAIEPVGSLFALGLAPLQLSATSLGVLQHAGFWSHCTLPLIFLNLLPYSKHFHVLTSIPNVFATPLVQTKLPTTADLEGKVEREEVIGLAKITDLSWKDVLDLYTCTECGRCSDNCPAYTTEKKLSPKHVTLALRDHLYACEPLIVYRGTSAEGPPPSADTLQRPEMHHADPPRDAYFTPDQVIELIPNVLEPDVVWACTTCRACEEQCPVMISYVDKFVQMRRHLVMLKNEFPAELMKPFNGIETNGNPWNMSAMDRAGWADGLDVPLLADHPSAAVLYWVGCAAAYDDRAKKIARATVQLLRHAGVDFAILGTEETCTGDPARRAGNEFLFQMMAQQNVETLKGYEAEKKTILTTCPHCFNTLLKEYPDFGGRYDVVHHAAYLNDLVVQGKLVPTHAHDGAVVFHDSCYLGRYNDVYDAPRALLNAIPGVKLQEVAYWNKNRGLCCGAGGAQMFMEEQNEKRVNVKRTLQLLDTGATTIASGCPFCMTMLTDGLKAQEREETVKQLDIAELLAQAVGVDKAAKVEAAE
ncbi:MAG: (Fe-S)-binding protein [Polyangiales bacterium]